MWRNFYGITLFVCVCVCKQRKSIFSQSWKLEDQDQRVFKAGFFGGLSPWFAHGLLLLFSHFLHSVTIDVQISCPCKNISYIGLRPTLMASLDFLWWLSHKESVCTEGDRGSVLGSARSPGGGNGSGVAFDAVHLNLVFSPLPTWIQGQALELPCVSHGKTKTSWVFAHLCLTWGRQQVGGRDLENSWKLLLYQLAMT